MRTKVIKYDDINFDSTNDYEIEKPKYNYEFRYKISSKVALAHAPKDVARSSVSTYLSTYSPSGLTLDKTVANNI